MSDPGKGPVLIDLEPETAAGAAPPDPARAPAVPDASETQGMAAMQRAATLASRAPSPLLQVLLWSFGALVTLMATTALYDFAAALFARSPALGLLATALIAAVLLALLAVAAKEAAAWFRLGRLDRLRRDAETALAARDLTAARAVADRLLVFYAGHPALSRGHARLTERRGDAFDADTLLGLAEAELIAPLDAAAAREVEAAARQVATVTALVPLALADVATALAANLRMIRRIAEIYGGRSGALGSWGLLRRVFTHLVATGALALTDDLIGSVAGGGVLSKLSRRFGEGVVNGALTARVGLAAMDLCRPLPFVAQERPSTSATISRALAGMLPRKD